MSQKTTSRRSSLGGRLAMTVFAILLASGGAAAADWAVLSASEQQVLLPFAEQWDELSDETQERLRKGAKRWSEMEPSQRQQLKSRFTEWQQLEPAERQRLRERYRKYRQLGPAQQRALHQVYRRFQGLPAQQRQEFRRRFEAASPAEREAFLRGSQFGRRLQQSQRRQFFNSLAVEQRHALRRMAADLSRAAKEGLWEQLRQRSEPQRSALIDRLQDMSAEQREQYLTAPASRDP